MSVVPQGYRRVGENRIRETGDGDAVEVGPGAADCDVAGVEPEVFPEPQAVSARAAIITAVVLTAW